MIHIFFLHRDTEELQQSMQQINQLPYKVVTNVAADVVPEDPYKLIAITTGRNRGKS